MRPPNEEVSFAITVTASPTLGGQTRRDFARLLASILPWIIVQLPIAYHQAGVHPDGALIPPIGCKHVPWRCNPSPGPELCRRAECNSTQQGGQHDKHRLSAAGSGNAGFRVPCSPIQDGGCDSILASPAAIFLRLPWHRSQARQGLVRP